MNLIYSGLAAVRCLQVSWPRLLRAIWYFRPWGQENFLSCQALGRAEKFFGPRASLVPA